MAMYLKIETKSNNLNINIIDLQIELDIINKIKTKDERNLNKKLKIRKYFKHQVDFQ